MANEAEASLSGSTGFQSGAASADPTLAQWAPEVWRLVARFTSAERMALLVGRICPNSRLAAGQPVVYSGQDHAQRREIVSV